MDFYRREGFVIVSSQADEDTGEFDFTMSWEKASEKRKNRLLKLQNGSGNGSENFKYL